MATLQRKVGFDCEFVEKPPEAFQSECPVCLQILREPYQVSCCGNSFCQVCIKRIKTDNKPCPTCKEESFSTFHNKGLQRSLYGYQVYCSHKQEGCEWKGELGQLDNHLNLLPQTDKQLEGCEYSEIECIHCSKLVKRSNITAHQNEICPKRPFSCEYCHSYESHYEDVINNHWPVCGYHPNIVIDCDFHHVGCDVRLPRKDMPAHLKENLVTHMSLQAASYSKLLASHNELLDSHNELVTSHNELQASHSEQSNKVTKLLANQTALDAHQGELEEQIRKLKRENEMLKSQVNGPTLGCIEFIMTKYKQHKKDNHEWFSPPFYTHPKGYKLCLRVDANGWGGGKSTHLAVFAYLMKGEFDDHLKWPFRGYIAVQLVDQEGKEEHYTETLSFDDKSSVMSSGRVTELERSKFGRGHHEFISHEELQQKYLKYNSLRFRILKITL